MDYTKFYFKDYLHDTRGLDPLTHGVYLLLLFQFLERETPLPDDLDTLYCFAEARTEKERAAVRRVLKRFWLRLEDGWIQKLAFVLITDFRNGLLVKKANASKMSGVRKVALEPTVAKRTLGDAIADCQRTARDSLAETCLIDSGSLAALINQESGIRNHKPRTTNQPAAAGASEPGLSAAEWANLIHPLFSGRLDCEMECKQAIASDIEAGQDPEQLRANVKTIVGYIEGRAPGKWANGFIGSGKGFWIGRKWKSPEAFAQRWDVQKNKNGAVNLKPAVAIRYTTHRDLPAPPCDWVSVMKEVFPVEQFENPDYSLLWGLYEPDVREPVIKRAKELGLLPGDWTQPPVAEEVAA